MPGQQFTAKPGVPEAGSGTVQRVSLAEGVGEDSPDAVGSAGFGTEPLDLGQQSHQLLLELPDGRTEGYLFREIEFVIEGKRTARTDGTGCVLKK